MAKFPALPLWTDAYLADTMHLDDEEHGLYLRLLMLMWRSPLCRVPNDDEWLARAFHRNLIAVQQKLRPLVAEFCQSDGNWISQKRLRKEWNFCSKMRDRNRAAAKSRWDRARAEKAASVSDKSLKANRSDTNYAYAGDSNDALASRAPSPPPSPSPESLDNFSTDAYARNDELLFGHPSVPRKSLKMQGGNSNSRNAPTPTLKKERKKDTVAKRRRGASAPGTPEFELYARGKEILGSDAGGLIAKLLKAKAGNPLLALAAILTAATKQNPREYIGALLRGQPSGEPFYDPAI